MEPKAVAEFVQREMIHTHEHIIRVFISRSSAAVRPLCDANWRYNCYPVLFEEAFPRAEQEAIKGLSFAWRLGLEHLLLTDPMLDVPGGATPDGILWAQLFYDSFLRELHSFFPPKSPFWRYYETYLYEYVQAMLTEVSKIWDSTTTYLLEEFEHVSAGKASWGKSAIAALAVIDGSEQKIPPLAASHDHFSVALQFRDDLLDWQEDFENGNHSFLIRHALLLKGVSLESFVQDRPTVEQLGEMIYLSGAAEWALEQSTAYFLRAHAAASVFNVPGWMAFLDQLSQSLSVLHDDLEAIRRRLSSTSNSRQKC